MSKTPLRTNFIGTFCTHTVNLWCRASIDTKSLPRKQSLMLIIGQ